MDVLNEEATSQPSEKTEVTENSTKYLLQGEDLSQEYSTDRALKNGHYDALNGYQRYDEEGGERNWKSARPSFARSLLSCTLCALTTTIVFGIPGGLITSILSVLDLRLAEACYSTKWNLMPEGIQRIRLTAQVVEGTFIQSWSFSSIFFIFGWKRLMFLNIPIWNLLGAACDAIYRLLLNTYGIYHQTWTSYPLNVLFIAITSFNFYRVTALFERNRRQRIKIALKLGMAYLLGTPMFILMNYFLFPIYAKFPSDTTKAVFSVLLPVVFIVPKAVISVCLIDLSEQCSPTHLSIFVVGFHTMTAIIARYLQANIEQLNIFVLICFVHGFETVFDKITFNLRMKAYRTFCKPCMGNRDSDENLKRRLAMNRILAEQSLSGMILETDTIFMSCALVEILSYYFGNGEQNWWSHVHSFIIRVSIASLIEFFFNVISVKIQTYYFNIPVVRVWRKRWWWVVLGIVTYTAYTTLYCSEYLYRPLVSRDAYNHTKVTKCTEGQPFF